MRRRAPRRRARPSGPPWRPSPKSPECRRGSRATSRRCGPPPSSYGKAVEPAITRAPGSTGNHDAAAADALGHLEGLESLAHQLLGVRPVRRILRHPDVHLEAVFAAFGQTLENALGHAVSLLALLPGEDRGDLVVTEASADGSLRGGLPHDVSEPAQDVARSPDLTRRDGLREMGDVEYGHREPVVRGDSPREEQPVELVPVRQPGYEVCGLRPAQGLLHLAAYDGVEGFQTRLRHPVRGLHQLEEEAGHLVTVQAGKVHTSLYRAPDAPPQGGEILYDPDRITVQLVLAFGDLAYQRPDRATPAESLHRLRTLQELDEDQDQALHPITQPGIGTVLDIPASILPPGG